MRLVTQADAADLKGTSRQAIHKLSRNKWGFFVTSSDGIDMVDIEHPHWPVYMIGGRSPIVAARQEEQKRAKEERRQRRLEEEKAKAEKAMEVVEETQGVETDDEEDGKEDIGEDRAESTPLSLVVNKKPKTKKVKAKVKKTEKAPQSNQPSSDIPAVDVPEKLKQFVPTSLRELKTYTEIQKAMVEINARQGDLLDRNIVHSRFQEVSNQMQMFVDLGLRVSEHICQILEKAGMEKEIQKIIDEETKKIIKDLKYLCMKKVR